MSEKFYVYRLSLDHPIDPGRCEVDVAGGPSETQGGEIVAGPFDDFETANARAVALSPTEVTCAECGEPLSSEDVEAGEEICLECGAKILMDDENPLLAEVWVGMKKDF